MSTTRIYAVSPAVVSTPTAKRLVRASTPAQALRHVTGTMFDVAVASQDDCIEGAAAGVKVEVAGAEVE